MQHQHVTSVVFFIKSETTDSHVEQDIVLWTNSQRPSNDVHVIAYVHPFDVNSARGGREQAGEDRSDKHHTHTQKKNQYFSCHALAFK